MEMIIFMGAQATGKSSFFKSRFFHTHMRVNLDMLKTRNRERILFEACLSAKQPMVIDNTNPIRAQRAHYIRRAIENQFRITGFYFQSIANEAIKRNLTRPACQRVPEVAIRATTGRMEHPSLTEGFASLNFVRLENNGFVVEEWKDDI